MNHTLLNIIYLLKRKNCSESTNYKICFCSLGFAAFFFSSFYHFWTDRWWGNARVSSWRFRNAAQLVMGILCGICWTAGAAKFSHQSPLTIGKFAWHNHQRPQKKERPKLRKRATILPIVFFLIDQYWVWIQWRGNGCTVMYCTPIVHSTVYMLAGVLLYTCTTLAHVVRVCI